MCCFLTLLMLLGYMDRMREDMFDFFFFFFSFNYKSRYVKHVLYPHTHTHDSINQRVNTITSRFVLKIYWSWQRRVVRRTCCHKTLHTM